MWTEHMKSSNNKLLCASISLGRFDIKYIVSKQANQSKIPILHKNYCQISQENSTSSYNLNNSSPNSKFSMISCIQMYRSPFKKWSWGFLMNKSSRLYAHSRDASCNTIATKHGVTCCDVDASTASNASIVVINVRKATMIAQHD